MQIQLPCLNKMYILYSFIDSPSPSFNHFFFHSFIHSFICSSFFFLPSGSTTGTTAAPTSPGPCPTTTTTTTTTTKHRFRGFCRYHTTRHICYNSCHSSTSLRTNALLEGFLDPHPYSLRLYCFSHFFP